MKIPFALLALLFTLAGCTHRDSPQLVTLKADLAKLEANLEQGITRQQFDAHIVTIEGDLKLLTQAQQEECLGWRLWIELDQFKFDLQARQRLPYEFNNLRGTILATKLLRERIGTTNTLTLTELKRLIP